MRIVILGSGAMGSLFGGLLTEYGADVTLYDTSPEVINALNTKGLTIEFQEKSRNIQVKAEDKGDNLGEADLVIVCVKAYHTGDAIKQIQSCLTAETRVLTLQNGLGNVESIARYFPRVRILAGITSQGAMMLAPGKIRHNGGGLTHLAAEAGYDPWAERIAAMLTVAGLETRVSTDLPGMMWTKVIVNAAINPITALTGLPNGELLNREDLLTIMHRIVDEAVEVAQQKGIKLLYPNMLEHVKSVCLATAMNKSSMLMDVLKQRRTEIDAINGAIMKEGRQLGIPTPINETVTALVNNIAYREETGRSNK